MKRPFALRGAAFLAVIVLSVAGYFATEGSRPTASDTSQSDSTPNSLQLHREAKTLPEIRFTDGRERALALADFSGKVVLLNIWATWCAPCRHEMPTLDRLQGKLGSDEFEVIALSIDKAGPSVVRKFFKEISVEHLSLYIDVSGKAAHAVQVIGLPATLLLNRQGQEIGRLIGPAEWDTPEMLALFKTVLEGKHLSGELAGADLASFN